MLLSLLLLICALLCEQAELLQPPVLILRPTSPKEGSPVTLTCMIRPTPHKSEVQLQFRFYRDTRVLQPGWSTSPEFQIPSVRREDSDSYWCEAKTVNSETKIKSSKSQMHVHRVPVSDVSLDTWPPGGQVTKGDKLVLICSVAKGTGDITFFWYKGSLGLNLERKTQRSLTAEFEIPSVRESDAEGYYCAADNGFGPRLSGLVGVTVRSPVSRPVLTLRAPRAQAVVGDVVELHCEAPRGSSPLLYRFYHEDAILENSSVPFGQGVSFNLSLTAEHSGNYSCEIDNGHELQHSETVTLAVKVPTGERSDRLTAGVMEGLLGSLGPAIIALLFCCWLKKKIGRRSPRNPPRSPPSPVHQESTHLNSLDPGKLQPIYENVSAVSGDGIYSSVYQIQQELDSTAVEPTGTHVMNNESSDIYSRVRKEDFTDVDYEDAM
ncbi:Fc receptor-like protein 1 [Oryctolagus cuniculus]|uniref:Fc receptor-like protein 1 n=1 Tax=Oryctolagus cuniculus TaxID=9986 RepID=UPI00222F81B4|nr:Fc receptor-like protein 1 [Oryctolagus cuniculus]